jgi:hypothetical protein
MRRNGKKTPSSIFNNSTLTERSHHKAKAPLSPIKTLAG